MTPAPLMNSQLQQAPLQAPQTLGPNLEEGPGTAEGKKPQRRSPTRNPKKDDFYRVSSNELQRCGFNFHLFFVFILIEEGRVSGRVFRGARDRRWVGRVEYSDRR